MFSDPYEAWKQGGRKGPAPGSQPAPAPAQPPAATTPPAPAPPAPAGPRQPTQAMPAPLSNGVNLEERFATQRDNVNYRDPSYSGAQWGAWEEKERQSAEAGQSAQTNVNKYNPDGKGCPPNMPFTSRPGPNGQTECAYKPDDCPDGSHVVGTPGRCVPNDGAGGAGGGGVGGGGGAAGGAGAPGAGGMDDMQAWWASQIKGQGTRYSPEAMAALEADQFSRARAQEKNQLRDARQDMAVRGTSRSANQNAAVRQIGVGTGQQIMATRADIQRKKIDADYQDKQAAINNAMNYVNSMRDWLLRNEGNAIQREQIGAQIRLAMANIQAQKDMTEQNYQNNLSTGFLLGN